MVSSALGVFNHCLNSRTFFPPRVRFTVTCGPTSLPRGWVSFTAWARDECLVCSTWAMASRTVDLPCSLSPWMTKTPWSGMLDHRRCRMVLKSLISMSVISIVAYTSLWSWNSRLRASEATGSVSVASSWAATKTKPERSRSAMSTSVAAVVRFMVRVRG